MKADAEEKIAEGLEKEDRDQKQKERDEQVAKDAKLAQELANDASYEPSHDVEDEEQDDPSSKRE